jgi:succinate dehydrogenase / fumarate reductase iron-sulfur subunit
MTDPKFIHLRIKRQDFPDSKSYWDEFKIPYKKKHNILSVLMEIQKNPVNSAGKPVSPVVWECNCMEEVCGACTMIINGKVRQGCSALVDQLKQPIVIEPMRKFPVVRDLMVDRNRMFEDLKKITAWVPIDGSFNLGPGPRMNPKHQEWSYDISRCMTCGCCVEVCPQFNSRSRFMGAHAVAQVRMFNLHKSGQMQSDDRIEVMKGPGGVTDCGNAQLCQQACPKTIHLLNAIGQINRQTTWSGILKWLNSGDGE